MATQVVLHTPETEGFDSKREFEEEYGDESESLLARGHLEDAAVSTNAVKVHKERAARVQEGTEIRTKSLIAELYNHELPLLRFVGVGIAVSVGLAFLFSFYLIHTAFTHWDYGCDAPLKWFWLLFGMVLLFQSVLMGLQLALTQSSAQYELFTSLSYIPAYGEVILLILGTVWRISATDACNEAFKSDTTFVLVVLWLLVVFGAILKCAKATEEQHLAEPSTRWVDAEAYGEDEKDGHEHDIVQPYGEGNMPSVPSMHSVGVGQDDDDEDEDQQYGEDDVYQV